MLPEDQPLYVWVLDVLWRLVLGDLCGVATRMRAAVTRRVVGDDGRGLESGFLLEEGSALRCHELRVDWLRVAAT